LSKVKQNFSTFNRESKKILQSMGGYAIIHYTILLLYTVYMREVVR